MKFSLNPMPRIRAGGRRTVEPSASAQIGAADEARDRGDWPAARDLYQKALALDPALADIWIQFGHALKECGDVTNAVGAYRRGIELAPSADAYLQLGHALKLEGRVDLAADAYLQSFRFDPLRHHPRDELLALGWTREDLQAHLAGNDIPAPDDRDGVRLAVAIDLSDLLHYFLDARVPTGIQRVQLKVASSLLREAPRDVSISLVCFSQAGNFWVEIPPALLSRLARMATSGGDIAAPDWQAVLGQLRTFIETGWTARFQRGTVLLNLGTSWWLQNYFLMIRGAKAHHGLRYVPFVHDLIPVLTPEHCVDDLRRDFNSWLSGVFDHADGYLVNSQATRRDLLAVARGRGYAIDVEEPVRLDADGREATLGLPLDGGPGILAQHGIEARPFVLFVSTIESRKNHLLAFETWLAMIRERGLEKTPHLVCVGNKGWMVEAALARLASSGELRRRVHILAKISDRELARLYAGCLFTIYPSAYEGWGLPVTESLCHGKVPLISSVSSLPEAGGVFAEYFDLESRRDFRQKLDRLIDDAPYRAGRERLIATEFRPRLWDDVAADILAGLGTIAARAATRSAVEDGLFGAEPGRYYSLARADRATTAPKERDGERYRLGDGWSPPESAGSAVAETGAELAFRVPAGEAPRGAHYMLCLQICALGRNGGERRFSLGASDAGDAAERRLAAGSSAWFRLTVPADGSQTVRVRVTLAPQRDRSSTGGTDARLCVSGFCFVRADDLEARQDLIERIALSEMPAPDLSIVFRPSPESRSDLAGAANAGTAP